MISYLLTFDTSTVQRKDFVTAIDSIAEVENWMLFFDNTACVVSKLSAKELTTLVRSQLPDANFILVELSARNRGGWLKRSVWNFIRDPKPVDA